MLSVEDGSVTDGHYLVGIKVLLYDKQQSNFSKRETFLHFTVDVSHSPPCSPRGLEWDSYGYFEDSTFYHDITGKYCQTPALEVPYIGLIARNVYVDSLLLISVSISFNNVWWDDNCDCDVSIYVVLSTGTICKFPKLFKRAKNSSLQEVRNEGPKQNRMISLANNRGNWHNPHTINQGYKHLLQNGR